MITHKVRYGGELQVGDFIGVGTNWGMTFGWYSGNGKSGNIQYITAYNSLWEFNEYHKRVNNPNIVLNYKDRRGFSLDHIGKQPVKINNNNRVVKITCPDDVFIGQDLQEYLKAKKILTDMKFLKQLL